MNQIKIFLRKAIPRLNKYINNGFSEKYLLYTNVGLSLSLSGLGDILGQYYEILSDDLDCWDASRTRKMSIFGMSIGVFCHYWYNFLDRKLPGYTIRTVSKKILIDQMICSPVCVSMLFFTTSILEGISKEEALEEFKKKAWILYAAEWTVWPPAQFINFYFLPTRYRVLYDNTISLGYDVFTSHVKHKRFSDNDEKS